MINSKRNTEQSWKLEHWKYRVPKFQRKGGQDAVDTVSRRKVVVTSP